MARLLVRAAARGRADLVKFQLVYAEELATRKYEYYPLFKQLEMPTSVWEDVAREARRLGLELAFDVYGPQSLRLALDLRARAVKLHVSDFFHEALFDAVVAQAPEVFFSAGGVTVDEIAALLERYGSETARKMTMLCGFQAEPTATQDNNLARLAALHERFPDVKIGFMDHSDGNSDESGWLGVLALPFGVSVIEKHITLDRSLELEDYVSAVGPQEFARYVDRIRLAEAALGSGSLELTPVERAYRERAVKVVVAAKALDARARIEQSDVMLLRAPLEAGRRPLGRIRDLVGRTVSRDVEVGEPIYSEDLT